MAILNNIPEGQYEGFENLLLIEESTFKDIMDGLSLVQFVSSPIKLAETVSKIKSLPEQDDIQSIFYSVGGLIFFLEKNFNVEQIVEDVCSIIEREDIIEDFTEGQKLILSNRLNLLLKSEQLYYAAKSIGLKAEYNNVFIQSRIVTDIRPIFSLNIDETPKAGMVIHNLHIHYRGEEIMHKDIYFALDSDDIAALKELILRAEKKEISLKGIFEKSKTVNLE